jgi:hypothetical protein
MSDAQQVPARDHARAAAGVTIPDAVRAAWSGAPPEPEPGQLWRALWDEVARFVVILRVDGNSADVAPVTVDPELATDDAHLLDAGETPFGVPVAVWLGLHERVPLRVLDRPAGSVYIAIDALNKAPQGRPVVTPLDDRAMEQAVLQDDMKELAAVPAADATLQNLLSSVTVEAMNTAGFSPPLALALRRGLRALTPEQAQTLAPIAGTTPEALLRANPPLPVDLIRDLDDPASREWVIRLAARQGEGEQAARLAAGYGAYALAARETGKGGIDWKSRIARYVQAILGDE